MKELLRRILRTAVTFVLHHRSHPMRLESASRCLIIAPHQDDESLGCAGLILARRMAGLPVSIVYVTDGGGSHPRHPRLSPADIASLRRTEARQAMQLLGVEATALHFLGAHDGTLARLSGTAFEDLARGLAALIKPLAPTELMLPCRRDGSSEHEAAYQLTMRALELSQLHPHVLEYPVWALWRPQRLIRPGFTCDRVWRLSYPQLMSRKQEAIACYVTQNQPTPPWTTPVLPRGFMDSFVGSEEFYLEYTR